MKKKMEKCNATASPNKLATETGDSDANPNYSLGDDPASDTTNNNNSSFDKNMAQNESQNIPCLFNSKKFV